MVFPESAISSAGTEGGVSWVAEDSNSEFVLALVITSSELASASLVLASSPELATGSLKDEPGTADPSLKRQE